MRQVFGEWGVVTETKSASYGILSAPVANNIRGYLILCRDTFFDIRSITIGDIFLLLQITVLPRQKKDNLHGIVNFYLYFKEVVIFYGRQSKSRTGDPSSSRRDR